MNRRMERLIPDDEYGNEHSDLRPSFAWSEAKLGGLADSRAPVDFEIAVAAVEAALDRILAEFNARKGGAS